MSNSNRSSFVLPNFNSIFAPAPNPKIISITSIGHPNALQPLQPHQSNIPAHISDPSSKLIQDQNKPYRPFNPHKPNPTLPPRPSSCTSDFEYISNPGPQRSYDHAYEARFRLAARPARLGLFSAGLVVNGNGNGNGNGGGNLSGTGSGNGNDRSRAHQRRALSMKVKVETQNRSSGGPRRGKVGKVGKAGKVGFKVPSLVKNLVRPGGEKDKTSTTTTTIIRDAKTFAAREDARALFNYKCESESECAPSGSGSCPPNATTSEPQPTSSHVSSTSTSSSSSAQLISRPSDSSSIFGSPVLISIPHPNPSDRIPPSRPSAHAPWDSPRHTATLDDEPWYSPYYRYSLHDEPWNVPESFPSLARKDVWTRQIKGRLGGKTLTPSWAAKLESERGRGHRDGQERGWGHGEGEEEGHGGVVIRQPRPVRAWEKELPAWVGSFDEMRREGEDGRDDKEENGNVAWCLSQWQPGV